MRSILLAFLGTVALASPSARAQAPEKVAAIEGITEYRLPNGLRVLLFPDASRPLVTVNLTVFVGSRHEGYGETGMAHLLEHLTYKGTPSCPDAWKALRDRGARANGTTWVDRTNYYETMPAGDDNLEFGLRLEADRMTNALIRREDLASEMTVVRNEFEMGENSANGVLLKRMLASAYEWHNYGKPTIGNRSDIERVPVENLRAFYRKFYQPDNAMLVVAGQFDPAKALTLVEKYFAPIPRPKRELPNTYTEEPAQDGERTVVLRRVGKVGSVSAMYHIPAGSHPDYAAVEILNSVLAAEPTGRLYKALVESKMAGSIGGVCFGWHDPGVVLVGASCEPGQIDAVRDTLIATVEGLSDRPVTADEVARVRAQLLSAREQLVADSNQLAIELSDWAAKGDWRLFFLHRDRIEKVTADDVNRVAKHYLRRGNRTVGLSVPTDESQRVEIPATTNVTATVEGYTGRGDVVRGDAFDATPANIDARTQRFAIGPIEAAFLPKKSRGEMVNARLVLRYGNVESLKNQNLPAAMLPAMLMNGTARHTRQQLGDEADKLSSGVRIASGGPGELVVAIVSKREHLTKFLALVAEMLREPSFPRAEFDTYVAAFKEQLDKMRTEPAELASVELERRLYPYPPEDIRYATNFDEALARLKAATLEQVKALYAEQVSAQAGELAVVGDFDPAETKAAFEKMLAGWTAKVPYRRVPRAAPEVPGGRFEIVTPDKANAFWVAALTFAADDTAPDYPALKLGNYLFGGSTVASRLFDRVRQKDGLSYSVSSSCSVSSSDPVAAFTMVAICNPANAGKVDAAMAEELARFLKDGPTDAELREAKRAYLEQLKVGRTDDGNLAAFIADDLSLGRTMADQAEYERRVAALTADQIAAAFRQRIDPKKLIVIRAGDFTKK